MGGNTVEEQEKQQGAEKHLHCLRSIFATAVWPRSSATESAVAPLAWRETRWVAAPSPFAARKEKLWQEQKGGDRQRLERGLEHGRRARLHAARQQREA